MRKERRNRMAKTNTITFEACLKQSTPGAKPIKFSGDGSAEITLEADAGEMANIVRLLTMLDTTFRVTITEIKT